MTSNRERVLLGQFMRRRLADPDDPGDPLAPGGVLDPGKSFLEQDLPSDGALSPSSPGRLPEMPPPPTGQQAVVGLGPAPALTPTSPAALQPSLATVPSRPPAPPAAVADPPRTGTAPETPHPEPVQTSVAGPQPPQGGGTGPSTLPSPPDFSPGSPAVLPAQPAPQNGTPTRPPTTVHVDHRGGPATLPDMPAPPHRPEYAPGGTLPPGRSPLDDIGSADARIVDVLRRLGGDTYAERLGFPLGGQGDLALDPELYLSQVKRMGHQLGRATVHAATQLALFAQNDRGRIWNPALLAPPPVAVNFIAPALDLPPVQTPPVADRDIHREMADGTYSVDRITASPPFYDRQDGIGGGRGGAGATSGLVARTVGALLGQVRLVGAPSQDASVVDDPARVPVGTPLPVAGMAERNRYTPDVTYSEHAVPGAGALADAVLDGTPSDLLTDGPDGLRVHVGSRRDPARLSRIFEPERARVSSPHSWRPRAGLALSQGSPFDSRLDVAAFPGGIIPARVKGENDFGFAVSDAGRPPPVDDDDAYVPLSFTDLRPISGLKYRTVYFRPFIKNLSEELSPQWNKANYYGRTDAVATYMSTGRTINLSFMLHAFGPEDVRTIYQKVGWLSSMVYPEYDKDLMLRSGPVVRMRVGDVIDALGPDGTRGLPGVIESLSYDYSDALWELKRDWKVPVKVEVTVGFTVLHDRPVGRGGLGKFGGIGSFRDGRYVPPSLQDQGPTVSSRDFVQVEDHDTSFRRFGGGNEYTLEDVVRDDGRGDR